MAMKRRTFGLFTGTSMLALMANLRRGFAQQASDFATLSKTTLTPMGAERAGNAAGTIPAWTGGFTTVPADWDQARQIVPDFWANEAPLYVVDASNMAQYADILTEGVQTLIQKQGASLKVYQTHRTAAAPQWVYDNIVQNSQRAALDPAGGRLGFTGGYGGIPFPVPDASDPFAAGAQIIWNSENRWGGIANNGMLFSYVVSDGQLVEAGQAPTTIRYPYYDPNGSLETYKGYTYEVHARFIGPATQTGFEVIVYNSTDPLTHPVKSWELLQGQGRVRKAPEIQYDTPDSSSNGIANYDENYGFDGALDRYDWKLLGKKEILIPYNGNKLRNTAARVAHGPKFINPDVLRWELHRVWVVEATLHPGARNVVARRRLYVDEDTWIIGIVDCYDASNTIYKMDQNFNAVFPNVPATMIINTISYNLQTGDYTTLSGYWAETPPENFVPAPAQDFNPQSMAANASY
jgi:hypothetical protein